MKLFQKIASVFLAIVFLLSSLGFTLNKMVCLKSGKTKISLVNVKDCCPEKKSTTPIIKSKCCDLQNSSFKLKDFSVVQKNEIAAHEQISFTSTTLFYFNSIATEKKSGLAFTDLPPPLYGRTLLNFISVLTI